MTHVRRRRRDEMIDLCTACTDGEYAVDGFLSETAHRGAYTFPHDVRPDENKNGIIAYYICSRGHRWTCWWSKDYDDCKPRTKISQAIRIKVAARDKGCCQECGSSENLEYDHIFPVSRGGDDDMDNLQLLCKKCNARKGARI